MNETKAIHDLLSYRDEAFVFLILVNNQDGWIKWILLMNKTKDPIRERYTGRWTQKQ